jgi:membrane-associated protein
MMDLIHMILHIQTYLADWVQWMGPWLYVLMFIIIFSETGLVITPFLPGDSLLFALGAMTTLSENSLNIWILIVSLTIAAILGDWTNYQIGNKLGRNFFNKNFKWALKEEHLKKTEEFYDKYGVKSIVLARFAPIVRTFVPFVAGIASMNRQVFFKYNIIGGVLWINIFLWLGHFFGNLPFVQKNFSMIIFAIIILSVMPMFLEYLRARRARSAT